MCGIAGILGGSNEAVVRAMVEQMRHRGPDDAGLYTDPRGRCILGHRRLSVIDTTAAGHQPMASRCGRYSIVYNGEVYNFRQIRDELAAAGDSFRSDCDTEVVLAAYARWGRGCVERFRGMFAFAIWDDSAGSLFLARDRLGIKPLYYASFQNGLVFASEISAVMRSGLVAPEADSESIHLFLALGAVPQPRTIIAGVRMLPAGHVATFSNGKLQVEQYWNLQEEHLRRSGTFPGDFREAADELRARLEAATRSQLVADVPVGAFLSGGIDSRIVVGLMSRIVPHPIRTFSVGFGDTLTPTDERSDARKAAAEFGCEHSEIVLTHADLDRDLDRILDSIDQPSSDGVNTFFVSQLARKSVTVALSGIGGDELFAGYPQFRRIRRSGAVFEHGSRMLAAVLPLARRVLPGRMRIELEYLAATPQGRLRLVRRFLADDSLAAAFAGGCPRADGDAVGRYYAAIDPGAGDLVNRVAVVELAGYLSHTLLRDCDAMTMAHSLEVRPLLLDERVVEFAMSLPGSMKLRGGQAKAVLVEACRDLVPPAVAAKRKRGFDLPLLDWLRGRTADRVIATLEGASARAILAEPFRNSLTAAIASGRRPPHSTWAIFMLLAYLDRRGIRVGPAMPGLAA
jgi:asparagine synthase (glutamine-hydrolysing)